MRGQIEAESKLRCQVLVIGSGPGGAVTASILAEAGKDVIIVEEGPWLPQASAECFSLEEMVQKYRNGGLTPALGKGSIAYVEGRCVGGGSEVNSGLYHRPPAHLFDDWSRRLGIRGLSLERMLPTFESIEQALEIAPVSGGPDQAPGRKLAEGAAARGYESVDVPRWISFQAGRWRRRSMSRTFIPRATEAGARVLPQTRACRLRRLQDGVLLECLHQSESGPERAIEIRAETVFVACGAIQSPALLRRSGLRKNIGESLELHPMLKLVAAFPEELNGGAVGVPGIQVRPPGAPYSFGCSISARPHLSVALGPGQVGRKAMASWSHLASYYAMLTVGKGRVRALPWHRDALVRYSINAADLALFRKALIELCQLLFAAGATKIYPNVDRMPPLNRRESLESIPRLGASALRLTSVHVLASCPMGEDRSRAAVDSYGRVHGEERVYLADASLLGSGPGVNPQGTVMSLAWRNAMHFLQG